MADAEQGADAQESVIVLPEQLTIAQSGEYYQLLMNRIEEGGDVELDAGSVSRIDASCVQLFFAVQQALAASGHTLRWNAISQCCRESVALLGMTEQLAVPA